MRVSPARSRRRVDPAALGRLFGRRHEPGDAAGCKLYEMYAAQYVGPGRQAGSGALYDLVRGGAERVDRPLIGR